MGIYPPVFGPMVWDTMMMFATNYPIEPTIEDKTNMLQWLILTMGFLPCGSCSLHAKRYVETHVPNVSSRESLTKYIVDFHNYVNISLGKSAFTLVEAKGAFISKIASDIKDLPRAMAVHKEDSERITALQTQLKNYEAKDSLYEDMTSHSIYMYTTIALSIALGIFLITIIVLAVRLKKIK